jgi:hypothetical protein
MSLRALRDNPVSSSSFLSPRSCPPLVVCQRASRRLHRDRVSRFDSCRSAGAWLCRALRFSSPRPWPFLLRRAHRQDAAPMISGSVDRPLSSSRQREPLQPNQVKQSRSLRNAAPFEVGISCGSQDSRAGARVPVASRRISSTANHTATIFHALSRLCEIRKRYCQSSWQQASVPVDGQKTIRSRRAGTPPTTFHTLSQAHSYVDFFLSGKERAVISALIFALKTSAVITPSSPRARERTETLFASASF